jgi:hypothetical protein
LLAPRPTPKLEDHPLSAVRDCLFNVFAATLHIRRPFLHPQPKDAPCRGDRDQLIMVTGTDLSWWQGPTYHVMFEICSFILVRCGETMCVCNRGLIHPLLFRPGDTRNCRRMNMEHWWNHWLTGGHGRARRKSCPSATFSTTYPT